MSTDTGGETSQQSAHFLIQNGSGSNAMKRLGNFVLLWRDYHEKIFKISISLFVLVSLLLLVFMPMGYDQAG
jgi:hypothetical protein